MKFFVMLTILMIMGGCPSNNEGKVEEVETTVVSKNFRDGKMHLSFDSNIDGASFQCAIDVVGGTDNTGAVTGRQGWEQCKTPLVVPVSRGQRLNMQVRAVTADGRIDNTPDLITYFNNGNNVVGGGGGLPVIQQPQFQVGTSFDFVVPRGMHITQYATNNTYQGAGIELVRLRQGQGLNYLGAYPLASLNHQGCSIHASDTVSLKSPSGTLYSYCRSFLDASTFFSTFSSNFARNHIEVASNPGQPSSRLLVQVYGPNEDTLIRKRFDDLCHGGRILRPASVHFDIPMFQGFFLADEVRVDNTFVCAVSLGGLADSGRYLVGGFTGVTRTNSGHDCAGRTCSYGQIISVVYMERADNRNGGFDDLFARNFQEVLMNSLRRNRP